MYTLKSEVNRHIKSVPIYFTLNVIYFRLIKSDLVYS